MTDSPISKPASVPPNKAAWPSIRLLVSVTGVQTIGWLSYYAQSQMYRSLMDAFDKREGDIGFLYSVEITVMVIAMGLAAGPLTRWSRVKVALVGSMILMAGNLASAFITNLGADYSFAGISSFHLLMATRIIVAVGGGAMVSSVTAALASAPHPERAFAIALITHSLLANVEYPLLPMALIPYGATGGFLFLAGSALLLLPFSFWLLPSNKQYQEATAKESVWISLRRAPNRKLALTAMLALFIYEIGQGGVDRVTALIAEGTGLDETATGWVFFWGANLGLLGGFLATWMGSRYGYLRPLTLGIIFNVIPGIWFVFCENGTQFFIVYFVWSMGYYFVTPFFFASMAQLDNLGRWAVAMEAAWTAGDALAPWIAGELVEYGGFLYIGALVLVTGIFGLLVLMSVGRSLDARAATATPTE